jgi:hypothetical protein
MAPCIIQISFVALNSQGSTKSFLKEKQNNLTKNKSKAKIYMIAQK